MRNVEQWAAYRHRDRVMRLRVGTSIMTEKTMRCLIILLQVRDLLFIRARTAASSLEMCSSLFSKSSPWILKIAFQMRERTPLPFFLTTGSGGLDSLLSPSGMPLSSAIAHCCLFQHKSNHLKHVNVMLNHSTKLREVGESFHFQLNE